GGSNPLRALSQSRYSQYADDLESVGEPCWNGSRSPERCAAYRNCLRIEISREKSVCLEGQPWSSVSMHDQALKTLMRSSFRHSLFASWRDSSRKSRTCRKAGSTMARKLLFRRSMTRSKAICPNLNLCALQCLLRSTCWR